MLVYKDAFGPEAAEAIRAWHEGVPVEFEQASGPKLPELPARTITVRARRSPAVLPVPKPLPSAIAGKHFGENDAKPTRPSPDEVRAIRK